MYRHAEGHPVCSKEGISGSLGRPHVLNLMPASVSSRLVMSVVWLHNLCVHTLGQCGALGLQAQACETNLTTAATCNRLPYCPYTAIKECSCIHTGLPRFYTS